MFERQPTCTKCGRGAHGGEPRKAGWRRASIVLYSKKLEGWWRKDRGGAREGGGPRGGPGGGRGPEGLEEVGVCCLSGLRGLCPSVPLPPHPPYPSPCFLFLLVYLAFLLLRHWDASSCGGWGDRGFDCPQVPSPRLQEHSADLYGMNGEGVGRWRWRLLCVALLNLRTRLDWGGQEGGVKEGSLGTEGGT